jgi:nitrite reductase/ring-hydroxylating ferredoxin subunit
MNRFVICVAISTLVGCTPDLSDDPIPWQPFDVISINLNLPAYVALKMDGGSMAIDDGGVRGIILHRLNASTYVAYERNCSYQPNSACATIDIDPGSKLYLLCSCCSSTFDLSTGLPTSGPAWRPLRQYETSLNGTVLTITDQIVE